MSKKAEDIMSTMVQQNSQEKISTCHIESPW